MKLALPISKEVGSQAHCPPEIADGVQVAWMLIRNEAEGISSTDFLTGEGMDCMFHGARYWVTLIHCEAPVYTHHLRVLLRYL